MRQLTSIETIQGGSGLKGGIFSFLLSILLGVMGVPVHQIEAQQIEVQRDQVMAKVNGTIVTMEDVVAAFERTDQDIQARGLPTVYRSLLEHIIANRLILAQGVKAGLSQDTEVQKRLGAVQEQIIRDVYLERYVQGQITEADVDTAYQAWLSNNPEREELLARHILLGSQEEALTVQSRLSEGEDFATLARLLSTDQGSGANGGSLGWFADGMMVPEFYAAANALKAGEISAPVQTQFGFHIIQLMERRVRPPPERAVFRNAYINQQAQAVITRHMSDLSNAAEIERFDLRGEPMRAAPEETTGAGS